ncbi:hypothetical protein HDU98_007253, partial [Podochytrium sp. JEL0797]
KQFTPHLLEEEDGKPGELNESVIDKATDSMDATPEEPVSMKNPIAYAKNMIVGTYKMAISGLFMDVANIQAASGQHTHEHAVVYDNRIEYLFSFLQCLTASFASFGHGSNDVANAIGPLAAVYELWSKGEVSKSASVEVWMLAMGGIAIDFGLAFYGWRVMVKLGNNLTYHSPSRGFCMELGAALSVICASFMALPVSTTQCIVGATIGVGLCNGSVKAINWKMVGWTFASWGFTVPVSAISSGLIYALLTRGPSFTSAPVAA